MCIVYCVDHPKSLLRETFYLPNSYITNYIRYQNKNHGLRGFKVQPLHIMTPCSTLRPQTPDHRRLICHHYNLIDVSLVQSQHKVIRNPLPCVFSGDGVANSGGLSPSLGILDANPDLVACLTVDQQAGVDDGVTLSAFHQTVFHDLLVPVRDLQQQVVQRDHGEGNVATEPRHACRAAHNNMRPSGRAAASQLGEGLQEDGHAFSTDFRVVYRHLGVDEFTADSGDDFIDELPFLGKQALGDGSDIVGITLDNLKIWGGLEREDGRKLGWGTAEGDALVACGEGVLEC